MPTRTSIPAHPTNYYVGRRDNIKYIVIHTGETGEGTTPAEGMGNWFAQKHSSAGRSSAHMGADTDSICRYVADTNTAFGAPGVNANGWHLEHAGRAGQTSSQWDDYESRLILANGALAAAEASKRLGVPAQWLTDDELRAGNVKGFITHAQASRVLGGTHWDPGPNFPADRYMALVRSHLGEPATPAAPAAPAPKEWDEMATEADIRKIVAEEVEKAWKADVIPSPMLKDNPTMTRDTAIRFAAAWALQARDKAIDPKSLAAAVAGLGSGQVSDEQLERVLRGVLGSLDN